MSEPVYGWWDQVPEHLKTKTQLHAAGLKPGPEHRALIEYGRGRRHRCYELFDVHEAVAKRVPTTAQRAAIEKAQLVRRTCVACGAVKERPGQLDAQRVCWPCVHWEEEYEHRLARDAAIAWVRQTLQDGTALILDTETVSLHGFACEISVIDLAGNAVFDTLINPLVPNEATHIHGITDDMTAHAPMFADIEPELRRVLEGRTVIVYNANYDRGVLWNELERVYERDHPKPAQVVMFTYEDRDAWRAGYNAWRAVLAAWDAERDRALAWFDTIDWQCAMLNYSAFCGDYSEKYEDYRFQRLPVLGIAHWVTVGHAWQWSSRWPQRQPRSSSGSPIVGHACMTRHVEEQQRMYVCDKGHRLMDDRTTVVERQETFPVRDVPITITTRVRVCQQCGADVYDRNLDSASLDRAYAEADVLRHQEA